MDNIRNFCIIAHIDHGKSTLADRFLELTGTVETRKMKTQYLDQMDLEQERGITIKMAPVRMLYSDPNHQGKKFILNLIDTPGHSDFGYEVSRALAAVEGAILLVDATQGIQAQTLANFYNAKKAGLKIIGAVNKVDLNPAQLDEIIEETANLIGVSEDEILKVSGKTGLGVAELLSAVIKKVPPPKHADVSQALIFDSKYDDHKGVIAFVRVFGGEYSLGKDTQLIAGKTNFKIKEVGYFSPDLRSSASILPGEIGYIATGIKDPEKIKIGDTIGVEPLHGYKEPSPVVFVSFYPTEDAKYDDLKMALYRLKLSDSSLTFEPDFSEVLGRGFKCGFLGRLHFEIIAERLEREFDLETVNSFPSVTYRVKVKGEWQMIQNPKDFPADYEEAYQPMVRIEILTPIKYLGDVLKLKELFHLEDIETENFGNNILIKAKMALADMIRDFDDKIKSVSGGYASFNYELAEEEPATVSKLEVVVATEVVAGLTRVVRTSEAEREGRAMVEKLKELLPRQQFSQALQAQCNNRIIARETIPPMKKDVTGYLYGGDRTRKMKLWKKQKEGKKRLKETGRVRISPEIFQKLLEK